MPEQHAADAEEQRVAGGQDADRPGLLRGDPVEGGAEFCFLFGSTVPFDEATLAELYPTHADYVAAFEAAADEAVAAGFLLRVDADAMVAEAEAADIGR